MEKYKWIIGKPPIYTSCIYLLQQDDIDMVLTSVKKPKEFNMSRVQDACCGAGLLGSWAILEELFWVGRDPYCAGLMFGTLAWPTTEASIVHVSHPDRISKQNTGPTNLRIYSKSLHCFQKEAIASRLFCQLNKV